MKIRIYSALIAMGMIAGHSMTTVNADDIGIGKPPVHQPSNPVETEGAFWQQLLEMFGLDDSA